MTHTLEDLIYEILRGNKSKWIETLVRHYLDSYECAMRQQHVSKESAAMIARQALRDYQFYATELDRAILEWRS